MRPARIVNYITFAADRCEFELEVSFWYTPGDEWDGPEIELGRVQKVLAIVTPSGLVIEQRWLEQRGFYAWAKQYAERELDRRLQPDSRVWWDLLRIAEEC